MLDPIAHNIHISSDEGLSWNLAPGIPLGTVSKLVEHPFGHNMAFALGKGEEHWVTYNRGETWQRWEIGVQGRQASLGGDTLSFHAEQGGEFGPVSSRLALRSLLEDQADRGDEAEMIQISAILAGRQTGSSSKRERVRTRGLVHGEAARRVGTRRTTRRRPFERHRRSSSPRPLPASLPGPRKSFPRSTTPYRKNESFVSLLTDRKRGNKEEGITRSGRAGCSRATTGSRRRPSMSIWG